MRVRVINSNGEGIAGANVFVSNSAGIKTNIYDWGAQTDYLGNIDIPDNLSADYITFSYVGIEYPTIYHYDEIPDTVNMGTEGYTLDEVPIYPDEEEKKNYTGLLLIGLLGLIAMRHH